MWKSLFLTHQSLPASTWNLITDVIETFTSIVAFSSFHWMTHPNRTSFQYQFYMYYSPYWLWFTVTMMKSCVLHKFFAFVELINIDIDVHFGDGWWCGCYPSRRVPCVNGIEWHASRFDYSLWLLLLCAATMIKRTSVRYTLIRERKEE